MNVREVPPSVDLDELLAGAQFADAFSLEVDGRALDARKAAEKIFARSPAWIEALLRLRNLIVTPLGLKTSAASGYWIIGFPCAYGLAFFTQLGAVGVWIGLSGGTAIYALLLILRFWRLAGRLQLVS
jgi:hypothetical protein